MRKTAIIGGAIVAFALASCSNPNPPAPYLAHNLGIRRGDFSYSVNLGSDPKDAYFLLTNVQDTEQVGTATVNSEAPSPTIESMPVPAPALVTRLDAFNAKMEADGRKPVLRDAFALARPELPLSSYRDAARGAEQAKASGVEPRGGTAPMNADYVGETRNFCFDIPYDSTDPAQCRLVTTATFPDGKQRKLSIWVDANEWTGNGGPITQAMVDALGERFFGSPSGSGDSIYSWVTNILGAEWGDVSYTDLIPFDSCITIMLCDISEDNSPDGGIVGYFYPKHNFTNASAMDYYGEVSNQRVMFYIDSVMYANASNDGSDGDTSWAVTDYWPEEVFSTLAHEFQHMIAFYQINVRDGDITDTWFAEMCSQAIEDLLADKISVMGPRGVSPVDYTAGGTNNQAGRIPLYNYFNDLGLVYGWTANNDTLNLAAYSSTYSFGSYLIRNYGGAEFLNDVYNSSGTPEERISSVSGKPFTDLLTYWSMAVILSDRTDVPRGLSLNKNGSFDSTLNGVTYHLGSINHYNYYFSGDPLVGPFLYSGSNLDAYYPQYFPYGTRFCLVGQNLTQERNFQVGIGLSNGLGVGVVAK